MLIYMYVTAKQTCNLKLDRELIRREGTKKNPLTPT